MDQLREWDYSSYNALYLGDYSCPRFKGNFSSSQKRLKEALEIVKSAGKKCYLSLYSAPNNVDLRWLEQPVTPAKGLS